MGLALFQNSGTLKLHNHNTMEINNSWFFAIILNQKDIEIG